MNYVVHLERPDTGSKRTESWSLGKNSQGLVADVAVLQAFTESHMQGWRIVRIFIIYDKE